MARFNAWLENRAHNRKLDPPTILCVNCEDRVPLWDELEQLFASKETQKRVRELQEEANLVRNYESKERVLVGEVISTVALAGQISREFSVSDNGIDMEIEFRDGNGEATGQKLYLQLKSGDSYLRPRKRDETEIFDIKDERHVRYWTKQAFPVMLVIRNAEGKVRWMEVRDWLKTETANNPEPVNQIIFEGERFDVMSVRRWRDRLLAGESNRKLVALREDYAELYREAFERFGTSALWSSSPVPDPTPEDAMAITRSLRVEGNLDARRLAERIEAACRAVN